MRCIGVVAVAALAVAALVGCSHADTADTLARRGCEGYTAPFARSTASASEVDMSQWDAALAHVNRYADDLAAAARKDEIYRNASLAMSRYVSASQTAADDYRAEAPKSPTMFWSPSDALKNAASAALSALDDVVAECRIVAAA